MPSGRDERAGNIAPDVPLSAAGVAPAPGNASRAGEQRLTRDVAAASESPGAVAIQPAQPSQRAAPLAPGRIRAQRATPALHKQWWLWTLVGIGVVGIGVGVTAGVLASQGGAPKVRWAPCGSLPCRAGSSPAKQRGGQVKLMVANGNDAPAGACRCLTLGGVVMTWLRQGLHSLLLWLLLASVWQAACGPSAAYVVVRFEAGAVSLAEVTRLDLELSLDGRSEDHTVAPGDKILFPSAVTLDLALPRAR